MAILLAGLAFFPAAVSAANDPPPPDVELETVELDPAPAERPPPAATDNRYEGLIAGLTIFALAIFVGFEVIAKVPPTLHTPLMSGSNAISGITMVGAAIVAAKGLGVAPVAGLLGLILATINVVGGFLVTHRMLAMFRKK